MKVKKRAEKAEVLNWIFGREEKGYQHKFLFPKDALTKLLEKSGFDNIQFEEPATHLYQESIRVTALKRDTPFFKMLSDLRMRLSREYLIKLDDQTEVMEFEERFIDNLFNVEYLSSQLDFEFDNLIFENSIISPKITLTWLKICEEAEAFNKINFEVYKRLAESLIDARFTNLLFNAFKKLTYTPNDSDDGYNYVFNKAMEFLEEAFESDEKNISARFYECFGFDEEEVELDTQDVKLFSKTYISRYARGLSSRGIKFLAKGDLPPAANLLKRSINSKIYYFYSLWNMAMCKGCSLADICQAGCSEHAESFTGSPYNYPFCLYRYEKENPPPQRGKVS